MTREYALSLIKQAQRAGKYEQFLNVLAAVTSALGQEVTRQLMQECAVEMHGSTA